MSADASLLTHEARKPSSQRKIRAPFALDESMCFYSPQENVDSLDHPRVAAWIDFVSKKWAPERDAQERPRIALLIPCCKYKPYPVSREHRAINHALLAAGWRPTGGVAVPEALLAVLDEGEDPDVLDLSPWEKDGVVLDRFVVSEPLGIVPYPLAYEWAGAQSPATSYDDPGLFEARGTSVSPEHPDFSATPGVGNAWKWGPSERQSYVVMHNRMAEVIAEVLTRVESRYASFGAWLSPGLTHRSFMAGSARRDEDNLPHARRGVDDVELALVGVGDLKAPEVTMMPTKGQLETAREQLAVRLAAQGRSHTPGAVRAIFARGDGHDTPLGLPEALKVLTNWLDDSADAARQQGASA
ncbi:hypothetical protein [Microbacterium sp. NPDC076911]|uniref:hypothetical protein n=1 Tax=Microbacterium sp. NPDC076911 TaxID=3154958 RepID=UPI0034272905